MPLRRMIKRRNNKRSLPSYLKSVLKTIQTSVFYGVREANEISDGIGKQVLETDTLNSIHPLHIYPLVNVINDAVTPAAGYHMDHSGTTYVSLGDNIQNMGAVGQLSQPVTALDALSKKQMYLNYHDIKILLWGRDTKKTVFNVSLVKFYKDELCPLVGTTTDSEGNELRQQFTLDMLRHLSNPVVNENHKRPGLQGYKVIWSKTYKIRETLSTEDERQHKLVKLFRKEDRLINFERPSQSTPTNALLDADTIFNHETGGDAYTHPWETKRNLYLVITSNVTQDDTNNATYDISIKSKYTVMGSLSA